MRLNLFIRVRGLDARSVCRLGSIFFNTLFSHRVVLSVLLTFSLYVLIFTYTGKGGDFFDKNICLFNWELGVSE